MSTKYGITTSFALCVAILLAARSLGMGAALLSCLYALLLLALGGQRRNLLIPFILGVPGSSSAQRLWRTARSDRAERLTHTLALGAAGFLQSRWWKALLCSCLIPLFLFAPNAHAQGFTWTQSDIGSVGTTGTYSFSSGTHTVAGSGSGPGGTSDNMCIVTTPLTGNFEMTARLVTQQNTDNDAFAGIMIRQSLSADSKHVSLGVTPGSGIKLFSRSANGGSTASVAGPAATLPVWLRLTKAGSNISTQYSTDGNNWTQLASVPVLFTSTYYVGFAVSSNVTGLSTVTFDNGPAVSALPTISPDSIVSVQPVTLTISSSSGLPMVYTLDEGADARWFPVPCSGQVTVDRTAVVRAKVSGTGSNGKEATAHIQIDPTTSYVSRDQLRLWLKCDNGLELDGSNNVLVWRDSSGNQRFAFRDGSAATPTLPTTAQGVTFNGTDQYLALPPEAVPAAPYSIFIISKPTALSSGVRLLDFGNGNTTDSINIAQLNSGTLKPNYAVFVSGTDNNLTPNKTLSTGQVYLFGVTQDSGNATFYVNDSSSQTSASGAVHDPNPSVVRRQNSIGRFGGGTGFFTGEIMDILIYDRVVTATERQKIEAYYGRKFGLAGKQPDVLSVTPPAKATTFSPVSNVTIQADPGAVVRYTTDGTDPGPSSSIYSTALTINFPTNPGTVVLKAAAEHPWGMSPFIQTAVFLLEPWDVRELDATNIPIKLWLRADLGATGPGGKVEKWLNLVHRQSSIVEMTAAQPNPLQRPSLIPNEINGKPAVYFDGSRQNLILGEIGSPANQHFFVVLKPTSAQGGYILDFGDGTNARVIRLDTINGTGARFTTSDNIGTTNALSFSNALTLDRFQLLEAKRTSGVGTIFVNGAQLATGSMISIGTGNRPLSHIGTNSGVTGNFFKGSIAEVIVYSDADETTKAKLLAYLLAKYQLVPVAAPTFNVPSGTLTGPTQVTISAPANATIRHTLDGSTPNLDSPIFDGTPINVHYSQTIKAIAVVDGVASPVSTATYTLNSTQWPAPDPGDPTTLQIQLQLPTTATP